ncbi:MAG: hypothetical protein JWO06_2511, partial [Bacteroidota bacterium]|nr:hypothetical protein [Bacteroidota bacterium]
HFYLLMLPSLFGFSITEAGRIITTALSILTFPVLFLLVKKRFSPEIALISCLLLSVNEFHLKYSVITMTEVPFIFFVFCALLFFYKFVESRRLLFLVLCSVFLNCCNMLRFEGWIVSAFLSFSLFYYEKNPRRLVGFAAMNAITIILYIFISLASTGYPVYGLTISNLEVKHNYEVIKDVFHHILTGLTWDQPVPTWLLILSMYGVWIGIKKKTELPWLSLSVLLLGMIAWKILTCSNEPSFRYFSTGLFLMLPFAALSISRLIPPGVFIRATLFFLLLCVSLPGLNKQYNVLKYQPYSPNGILKAAEWIKNHKKPGEQILFNSSGTEFSGFRLLTNTYSNELYFPPYPGMKKFENYREFSDTVFFQLSLKPDYKFMVYQTGLEMDSVFHLPRVQQQLQSSGPGFDSVFSVGSFRIYSIRH